MISLETFQDLFRYNYWARDRQLEACALLSPAQFSRPLGGSFPSVRDTLDHMLAAEWIWLERLQGRSPHALPTFDELLSVTEINQRWQSVERGFLDHLSSPPGEQMSRNIVYTNFRTQIQTYPVWMILLHLINHQTYHRGQVTTLLRQLGATTAAVDLLVADDCGLFGRRRASQDGDDMQSK